MWMLQILILIACGLCCWVFYKVGYLKGDMAARAESDEMWSRALDCAVDAMIEGAESWKQEYDDCRRRLEKIVSKPVPNNLKDATERNNIENEAREWLKKYQHF